MLRFKLGETDAAKYKGGDAWFAYDTGRLRVMTAHELIELESHLGGYSISQIETDYFGRRGYLGQLGVLYIARRLSGVIEAWENFAPILNEVEAERFEPAEDPGEGEGGQPAGEGEPDPSPPGE
jgi:hypothetical protein